MKDTLTLFEYDHLCTDDGAEDTIFIDSDAFNALELFLCSQAANENINAEETHEVFRFSSRRGRKTLAAQNYVGVISAGNTEIEILPKIGKKIRYCDSEYERVRRTFLENARIARRPFQEPGLRRIDNGQDALV